MVSESSQAGDSAAIWLPKTHQLLQSSQKSLATPFLRPFEHWGHELEELFDLAQTHHHGGDPVVSPQSLVAAVVPTKNAIRVRTHSNTGEIKQLIFDHNARTNAGGTWLNILMGGDTNANLAYENHSGAVTYTATTVTPTASPTWTVNQWAGHLVVGLTSTGTTPTFVYGVIKSNTATALTIDQWYTWASTTGAVGSTPAANTSFGITLGQGPARWIGLSTDAGVEDIGDTALASELVTGFATVPRWYGAYTQTTAPTGTGTANSNAIYKLDSGVQTANATNTITKLGLLNALTGGILAFEKKLATAAAVISGDTLDASWSITDA
jgi:hypothetical protein